MVRMLHTSDWHLGKRLYDRARTGEFESFLCWLVGVISGDGVDVLVVAGDIFDTKMPPVGAQRMYYRFLAEVRRVGCRHVVVIGGNHDSGALLDAPRDVLLGGLDVHVVGCCRDDVRDEVLVLRDGDGQPEMIVCAVPFLNDSDVRASRAGESDEDKELGVIEGIAAHYASVLAEAERLRAEFGGDVPVVGTGHLFAAGGTKIDGDGVREIVGTVMGVPASVFGDGFDYVALGHLHEPQVVGGRDNVRYSGSSLQMGFGEAGHGKRVIEVDFDGCRILRLEPVEVPEFARLLSVSGDLDEIGESVGRLAGDGVRGLLEVVYTGDDVVTDLEAKIHSMVRGTCLEPVHIVNRTFVSRVLGREEESESLADIKPDAVFERYLRDMGVTGGDVAELMGAYMEAYLRVSEGVGMDGGLADEDT